MNGSRLASERALLEVVADATADAGKAAAKRLRPVYVPTGEENERARKRAEQYAKLERDFLNGGRWREVAPGLWRKVG